MQKKTKLEIATIVACVVFSLFTVPFWLGVLHYTPPRDTTYGAIRRTWHISMREPPMINTSLLGLWETSTPGHYAARTFILRDGTFIDDNYSKFVLGFEPPLFWTTLP
jgi:hypothetical protein